MRVCTLKDERGDSMTIKMVDENKSAKYWRGYSFLAVMSATILLLSNLAATKIFSLLGIPVDGGVIIYPISFILGDLIVEKYGQKRANRIIYWSALMNVVAMAILLVVKILPPYESWHNQNAFETILGFAPRVMLGSVLAFVASGLVNNFSFIEYKKKGGKFISRAILSSLIAKVFDVMIFEMVAFLGILPFKDFLLQMLFAYVVSIAIEIVCSPLTSLIATKMKKDF